MKIELNESTHDSERERIEIGDILITGYMVDGKTVITITSLNGGDFLLVQPVASNSIIVKAGKTIKI